MMGVLSQPPVSQRGGFCSPQPQHACPPGRGPWERRLAALKLGLLSRVIGAIFLSTATFGGRVPVGKPCRPQSPCRCGLCPRPKAASRPAPREQSAPAPRPGRPGPGARRRRPGRTTGNNGGLGRGRDRQVRPPPRSALTSSPPPQRPPLRQGPGARLAARAGRHRAVPATRPRPRGPRAAPAGGSSCGRARPGPPASPPALQAVARRGLGARAGTRAARSPPGAAGARAHKGTRATDREGARGPWGVCLPDEGGGGHTRRDTWERQTPL